MEGGGDCVMEGRRGGYNSLCMGSVFAMWMFEAAWRLGACFMSLQVGGGDKAPSPPPLSGGRFGVVVGLNVS